MASWLRSKKSSVTNLKAADERSLRSTTPTPGNVTPVGKPEKRTFLSGLLTIRVFGAEGLELPAGTNLPAAVQQQLASHQGKVAASVSPSSVNQQRLTHRSKGNRQVFRAFLLPLYSYPASEIASSASNAGGCRTS